MREMFRDLTAPGTANSPASPCRPLQLSRSAAAASSRLRRRFRPNTSPQVSRSCRPPARCPPAQRPTSWPTFPAALFTVLSVEPPSPPPASPQSRSLPAYILRPCPRVPLSLLLPLLHLKRSPVQSVAGFHTCCSFGHYTWRCEVQDQSSQ